MVKKNKTNKYSSEIVSSDAQVCFDELAEQYDAWFDGAGKLIFDIEVEAFKSIIPALPEPFIEVGVGSGRFAEKLGIGIGIDPSIRLLEMAEKRGIDVTLARGEEHIFNEKEFGTVFMIVTLCFLEAPVEVLKEAHRILITDGKIVFGLVLRDSPWGKYYMNKKKEGHRFYRHAIFYNYSQLADLLNQSGFIIEKVISTLFQLPADVKIIELPVEGFFFDAGFTIVVAKKAV